MKKARVEGTFLQAHLLQQAISFASTASNRKSLSHQNNHQKMRAKPFDSLQQH
jgi:hypothetical protein